MGSIKGLAIGVALSVSLSVPIFIGTWQTSEANGLSVPSGTYAMDPTHSSLIWRVNHFGLSNYTARLSTMSGSLNLLAEDPSASSISVTIDPSSVATEYPFPDQVDFDAELQGAQWLNVEAYPEITFESTNVSIDGDQSGQVTGDLTFLGVTKSVTLDVTLNGELEAHPVAPGNPAAIGFTATGTFDRTEFGLSTFAPMVGETIEVIIQAEFLKE